MSDIVGRVKMATVVQAWAEVLAEGLDEISEKLDLLLRAKAEADRVAAERLIQLGAFKLHSGKESDFKLVADAFIRDNLDGLVHLIRKMVGPFKSVTAVQEGGDLLANTLYPYRNPADKEAVDLIVDDVLTTGGSMEVARSAQHAVNRVTLPIRPDHYIRGVVVFARGECPHWVRAIFQLPQELW